MDAGSTPICICSVVYDNVTLHFKRRPHDVVTSVAFIEMAPRKQTVVYGSAAGRKCNRRKSAKEKE